MFDDKSDTATKPGNAVGAARASKSLRNTEETCSGDEDSTLKMHHATLFTMLVSTTQDETELLLAPGPQQSAEQAHRSLRRAQVIKALDQGMPADMTAANEPTWGWCPRKAKRITCVILS